MAATVAPQGPAQFTTRRNHGVVVSTAQTDAICGPCGTTTYRPAPVRQLKSHNIVLLQHPFSGR